MRTQKVWQGGHQKRGMQEGAAMHQWALSAAAELIAANVHWPGKAVTMRHLRLLGPATVFVCLSLTPVQAQTYPDRVIKAVVPYIPGSPVDVLARIVAQHLGTRLGQNVIVENRPGAGTTLGMKAVIGAPPDGYTLLVAGQALASAGVLYPDLSFDPATAFAPVATLAGWSHVLVER